MENQTKIPEDFIEELKAAFIEGEFSSRMTLIETYHVVGKMICTQLQGSRNELLHELSPKVGKSVRSLWYAAKFYEVYPDLQLLPEGKNVSMNKIITKYLTTSKQEECTHPEDQIEIISFKKCKSCGSHLGIDKE